MESGDLVRRVQAGDVDAFVTLTRQYQHMVFGYAFSLLGDFHLAQDATQETFIAAYLHASTLHEPQAFPGWLRTVTRHQCGRARRRWDLELVPIENASSLPDETGNPERCL